MIEKDKITLQNFRMIFQHTFGNIGLTFYKALDGAIIYSAENDSESIGYDCPLEYYGGIALGIKAGLDVKLTHQTSNGIGVIAQEYAKYQLPVIPRNKEIINPFFYSGLAKGMIHSAENIFKELNGSTFQDLLNSVTNPYVYFEAGSIIVPSFFLTKGVSSSLEELKKATLQSWPEYQVDMGHYDFGTNLN